MTFGILFVCLGNICRSPAAHAMLRARRPDLRIDSAGTGGWHAGAPPYGPMIRAAGARGIVMDDLRARQIARDDFHRFDLIVAMDDQNRKDLEALRPSDSPTRLCLLTDFAPQTGADHVPDPYYTRDFDGALDLIDVCTKALSDSLPRSGDRP